MIAHTNTQLRTFLDVCFLVEEERFLSLRRFRRSSAPLGSTNAERNANRDKLSSDTRSWSFTRASSSFSTATSDKSETARAGSLAWP